MIALENVENALLDAGVRILVELLHDIITEPVIDYRYDILVAECLPYLFFEMIVTVDDSFLCNITAVLVGREEQEIREQYFIENVLLVIFLFGLENVLDDVIRILFKRKFKPRIKDLIDNRVEMFSLLNSGLVSEDVDELLDDETAIFVHTETDDVGLDDTDEGV